MVNKFINIKRFVITTFAVLLTSLSLSPLANANTLSISGSYPSKTTLLSGLMVALDNNQNVQEANVNNVGNLLGVVVNKNSTNISYDANTTSAQVGTTGTFPVDVSNINGDIVIGDKITASIIDGFGMKATKPGRILGVAEQNFSSKSKGATKRNINKKVGDVYVGQILVNVNVGDYAGIPANTKPSALVAKFQSFASNVANKQVSENNAVLGLLVFSIGLLLALVMLVLSMIIAVRSIGRNPLAKNGVLRYILLIILMVIVIITISAGAAYFVIKG